MARKLILVGCGNMGHAMLVGWLGAGILAPDEVAVVEPNDALRERAAATGVTSVARPEMLPGEGSPDFVLFAVKPQVMRDVVQSYRGIVAPSTTVISVAAGTRIAVFEELLGSTTPVVRCMPNTPAAIGKGMMVLVANGNVTPEADSFVGRMFAANGAVARLEDEALMDAVTAVSGSGPAYVFHFIECLREAGRKAGLPDDVAGLLAMQTVAGAGALAAESGEEPGRLREQVTSPNGTTAAALAVLMSGQALANLVNDAVAAAKRRSIELG